jgi:serine/threonine protein kinase
MSVIHSAGQPENDGERLVLQLLRDQLPPDWHVAANFWLEWRPRRYYECDAAVFSPKGRAHLIEIKAWVGQIRGNEREWELPGLAGGSPTYRSNPVKLTQRKSQILREQVRGRAPALSNAHFEALVVLVSDTAPELEGNFSSQVILAKELVAHLLHAEPRQRPDDFPEDGAERLADLLTAAAAPLMPPDQIGSWRLLELVEATPYFEIWRAVPRAGLPGAAPSRLKRYTLDPLLTGDQAMAQRDIAIRELDALTRLSKSGAQVLAVSAVEDTDDGFIVVTEWPRGESLSFFLSQATLDEADRRDLFREFLAALASVHRGAVVHRNLSPASVYVDVDGGLLLTDFDYARVPAGKGAVTRIAADLLGEYVAPEVRQAAQSTSARSDVWSSARIGMAIFGSPENVPAEWDGAFKSALDDEPMNRPANADEFLRLLSTSPGLPTDFEPNDEIDERYVVRGAPIRTGGLSIVLQVYDSLLERLYAAKFVRPEFRDRVDPRLEFERLSGVPDHPGLVKPTFVQVMHYIKRRDRTITRQEMFQVTPWIDGTPLDALIPEHLPMVRVLQLGADLASVLGHLHAYGLLHRDVKPENVLVLSDGTARLIDFNVSGEMHSVGTTEVGTVTYRPPDAADAGWDESCDLFALSAVLVELLEGRRLSQREARERAAAIETPPGLSDLLLRGLAPLRADRIVSAVQFHDSLIAFTEKVAAGTILDRIPPEVPREELERSDWNAYQYRLLSFFSQSRTSNAGTRGLDDFSEWFYVPTALDVRLTQDLLAGNYSLVIVTGNAGDGKTAFIQRFESELSKRGARVERHADGNGVTAALGDRTFVTNWDGSQDEGEESSDRVLQAFFGPFAGAAPGRTTGETRLIAINEGRILDFLETHRVQFGFLASAVERRLDGSPVEDALWLGFVNLNLRALTSESSPVVPQLLTLLAAEPLWSPCESCRAKEVCYARGNAESLRDPVLGPRIKERIRKVLDVARLRRRLHITMRDLRSALAYSVAGDRTCAEIISLADKDGAAEMIAGRYYNSLFAGREEVSGPQPAVARDRLLRLVGTLDVARTPEPDLDSRLWTEDLGAMHVRGSSDQTDIRFLREARETVRFGDSSADGFADRIRFVHASLRRLHFMEREDPGWIAMLPYRSLGAFLSMLEGATDEALPRIVQAISNSEGRFLRLDADQLSVRLVGELEGADRSFVVHAASLLQLEPVIPGSGLRYLEFQPDIVRLQHRERDNVRLDVDLDLFETLERVRAGFRPSREEMQGAWLNLRVFKEQLGAMPADELLLTRGERQFYRIVRSGSDALQIEALTP